MVDEIHYRVGWRARGYHPGHHRSAQGGGGLEFLGHAPLHVARDPRRLDLRSSLRDPFEQILVRTFRQRSQVAVFVLGDLSASVGFRGERRKLEVMAGLVESLTYSSNRTGDRFGFIGFDAKPKQDFLLPATHFLAAGLELAQRLRALDPRGISSSGLIEATTYLPHRRALVFLVSDFHFPLDLLEQGLSVLSRHSVVPIVMWDRAEFEQLPRFGFVTVQDSETQRRRTLFMRTSLRERIAREFARRREVIESLCFRHQCPALFLEDGFNAERVTQYFYDCEFGPLREHAA